MRQLAHVLVVDELHGEDTVVADGGSAADASMKARPVDIDPGARRRVGPASLWSTSNSISGQGVRIP